MPYSQITSRPKIIDKNVWNDLKYQETNQAVKNSMEKQKMKITVVRGLRQREPLSAALLNMVLEMVVRTSGIKIEKKYF